MRNLVKWVGRILGTRFIPIRTKFMVSMTITVLLFGAINLIISRTFVLDAVREQVEQKAELISGILEQQIVSFLGDSNLPAISSLIETVKQGDPDLVSIEVFDASGKILAHTRDEKFSPQPSPGSGLQNAMVSVHQKTTLLQGGRLGRLEIEINETMSTRKAKSVGMAMTAMIAVFLVLGMGGALVFSHYISDPIYKILKAFREFEPGGSMPESKSLWNDEMRLLSQGFQSMMERINETDRNFKQAQAKILETERLASMGTLATGLAHEINNPIAGIQMCLVRLQKSSRLDTNQSEYLSLISEATNHIKGVIGDLLNYAQNSDRENYPVDLRTVITDAAKLTQPRLNRNQIQLHLHLPEDPCVVSGVKPHLIQVLVNGLINALDAIHRDGNIWITLRRQSANFRIDIEDDGKGIAAETASKAFEPFFTTKGKKGTGLGLYVSFGIVKAHQGSLELMERTEGKGAVLAVTLPAEG